MEHAEMEPTLVSFVFECVTLQLDPPSRWRYCFEFHALWGAKQVDLLEKESTPLTEATNFLKHKVMENAFMRCLVEVTQLLWCHFWWVCSRFRWSKADDLIKTSVLTEVTDVISHAIPWTQLKQRKTIRILGIDKEGDVWIFVHQATLTPEHNPVHNVNKRKKTRTRYSSSSEVKPQRRVALGRFIEDI